MTIRLGIKFFYHYNYHKYAIDQNNGIHYFQFFNVPPKLLTPRPKKQKKTTIKEKKTFNTFVEIQLTYNKLHIL